MSKKAPTFGEEMNCQPKSLSIQAILNSVPTGSGESADKPIKKSLRWSKASGLEMMGAPPMVQEPQILQGGEDVRDARARKLPSLERG